MKKILVFLGLKIVEIGGALLLFHLVSWIFINTVPIANLTYWSAGTLGLIFLGILVLLGGVFYFLGRSLLTLYRRNLYPMEIVKKTGVLLVKVCIVLLLFHLSNIITTSIYTFGEDLGSIESYILSGFAGILAIGYTIGGLTIIYFLLRKFTRYNWKLTNKIMGK